MTDIDALEASARKASHFVPVTPESILALIAELRAARGVVTAARDLVWLWGERPPMPTLISDARATLKAYDAAIGGAK